MPGQAQPSPFNPGYGRKPAVFGGHESTIRELTDVFATSDFGENQTLLVSGLRGAGKTAMLSVLQDAAESHGWLTIRDDASTGLMDRVMSSSVPTLLHRLTTEQRHRFTSFNLWHFGATWERVTTRDAKPLLRNDLVALSTALDGAGILITIDEVSSGRTRLRELSRFALEVQHAMTTGANIMIAFAGVKIDLDVLLKQEHLTFLRRSRPLDFRRLSPNETMHVLRKTVEFGAREITDDALRRLTVISQGYPYLIQLAGDYAWRHRPDAPTIDTDDAEHSFERAIQAVQRRVISRVYDDLSEKDKDFLRAMAQDEGQSKISDIQERMDKSPQYVQVYKNRLIDSGYVQQAGRGNVEFSLPYLDQYIRTLLERDDTEIASPSDGWDEFPAPRL